ncbi:helix-turn-helix domain-containing protein [Veillonella magna]|mgnify:CR=1 FL=1|jgi:predicted site-specific integrase-resolvase|uniref:helix-turn-helix domain-containing protein n=1 Tax=Veillonella magna TaxID=464322 RepID=UPI0004862E1B|nr:helix-turn-helix domain-containing protein [Veillonella magna]
MKKPEIPIWHKMMLSLDEASALTGISREVLEEWRRESAFPSICVGERGGKCKVNRLKLQAYIDRKTDIRFGETVV